MSRLLRGTILSRPLARVLARPTRQLLPPHRSIRRFHASKEDVTDIPLDADLKVQMNWVIRSLARLDKAMTEVARDVQGTRKDVQAIIKTIADLQRDVHVIHRDTAVLKWSAKLTNAALGCFILMLLTISAGPMIG
ncbi:hypothetical protein TWF696_002507 [Orbilia brochopaga]|uniref:Uncharacterized protein n=1 Tax=Orbilia brochopaga TaxID=3140254 RepID=A0AAV9U4T3_9PEZI